MSFSSISRTRRSRRSIRFSSSLVATFANGSLEGGLAADDFSLGLFDFADDARAPRPSCSFAAEAAADRCFSSHCE